MRATVFDRFAVLPLSSQRWHVRGNNEDGQTLNAPVKNMQLVWEVVSYRGLFTAGWFGMREKHCFRLKIYDRLRTSEQADVCKLPSSISDRHLVRVKCKYSAKSALTRIKERTLLYH